MDMGKKGKQGKRIRRCFASAEGGGQGVSAADSEGFHNLFDGQPDLRRLCPKGDRFRIWSAVKPGQDLVAVGYIGMAGTVWMARHREHVLNRTLPRDYVETAKVLPVYMERLPSVDVAGEYGASMAYAVTEGGIFGGLWEMAQIAGKGLYTRLKDIPVWQHTVEFCEVFDLNPYQLLSGGCLLMAVENGCDVLFRLSQAGVPCSVVGKITDNRDRVVAHDDTCRYLTKPQRDEIYQLLENM